MRDLYGIVLFGDGVTLENAISQTFCRAVPLMCFFVCCVELRVWGEFSRIGVGLGIRVEYSRMR